MMKKLWQLMVVVALVIIFETVSLSGVLAAVTEWKPDGVISVNEYTKQQKIGDIEVFTRIEGDYIMMAFQAKATGYMALGIGPEQVMKGADMIFAYVKDGKAFVEDAYSTGPFGPLPADTAQGGTMDIQMIGGSEKDGQTTVEFKRRLDTGDKKDKPLKLGDNKVIWALGSSDDITKKHIRRGYGNLAL